MPRKASGSKITTIRIPVDLLEAIDAEAEKQLKRWKGDRVGPRPSRSTVAVQWLSEQKSRRTGVDTGALHRAAGQAEAGLATLQVAITQIKRALKVEA